jgi:aldehyde dehydrogenase (NAD+)
MAAGLPARFRCRPGTSGGPAYFRPSDNKVYAEISIGCPEIVDRQWLARNVHFARQAGLQGGPRERAQILRRWADLIEGHAIELGSINAVGSTRPIQRKM